MFDKEVSIQAIVYIVNNLKGYVTDMHKISKILYFADQNHLSQYGRTITGDDYIKMPYGPVPSKIDDIFKALRGESYFSNCIQPDVSDFLEIKNKYVINAKKQCNTDYLSVSDRKCLDSAIMKCKDKSFGEITQMSHDFAWNNTQMGRRISEKDILREIGDSEAYIEYATAKPTFKLNTI